MYKVSPILGLGLSSMSPDKMRRSRNSKTREKAMLTPPSFPDPSPDHSNSLNNEDYRKHGVC